MNIDEDLIHADFEPDFREFFKQYREAMRLLMELFQPLDTVVTLTKLQEIVFAHCARALQLFHSVFFLARLGFGLDCVILTRSLVELTINAYYMAYEKKRQGLYPYVLHGRVEQWENFRKLLEFQKHWNRTPTIEDQLGKERVREMRRTFNRSKKRFLDRHQRVASSWSKLNLRQRAQFLDQRLRSAGRLEELYVIVNMQMGNPVVHASALGLSQIPTGTSGARFDASPSPRWVEESLRIALACIFLIGQLANEHGKLGRDELVRQIEEACRP